MKCPNCGNPYHEQEIICSTCGQPLSNADFIPVKSRFSRKRKRWFISFILIFILAAAGIAGYFFYVNEIEKRCLAAVGEIFNYAREMDFSSVDPAYLPDSLKENPNIREYIQEYIHDGLETAGLNSLPEESNMVIESDIIDMICEEILSSARYQIISTTTTYRSCTVNIRTENIDFSSLFTSIAEELWETMYSHDSFWENIQYIFSSIFSNTDENIEEFTNTFLSLYEENKKTAPKLTEEGTIVFEFTEGKWTLLSVDEELFYAYYGLSSLQLP